MRTLTGLQVRLAWARVLWSVLCGTGRNCVVLYYYTTGHGTVPYCTPPQRTAAHCTVMYCTEMMLYLLG